MDMVVHIVSILHCQDIVDLDLLRSYQHIPLHKLVQVGMLVKEANKSHHLLDNKHVPQLIESL